MIRNHVVIAGTGRSGTTVLVELLTHLGFDTGFTVDNLATKKNNTARAGLEFDVRDKNSPYIVKSPLFFSHAAQVFNNPNIKIKHLFIPIRDLYAAAESRRYVVNHSVSKLPVLIPNRVTGGLFRTSSMAKGVQEGVLLTQVYRLVLGVANTNVPVTFIRYPRLVKDCAYLFDKLQPVLSEEEEVSYKEFCVAFNAVVDLSLVHEFGDNDDK